METNTLIKQVRDNIQKALIMIMTFQTTLMKNLRAIFMRMRRTWRTRRLNRYFSSQKNPSGRFGLPKGSKMSDDYFDWEKNHFFVLVGHTAVPF